MKTAEELEQETDDLRSGKKKREPYPPAPDWCKATSGVHSKHLCLYYRDRWGGVDLDVAYCTKGMGECPVRL